MPDEPLRANARRDNPSLDLLSPFRFLKHKRERQLESELRAAAERAAERDHQRLLLDGFQRTLETVLTTASSQNRDNAEALMELAKASIAQADGFSSWLKSFQITTPPTTSVVSDDDEFDREQAALAVKMGIPIEQVENIPEEFRLALELRNGFMDAARQD